MSDPNNVSNQIFCRCSHCFCLANKYRDLKRNLYSRLGKQESKSWSICRKHRKELIKVVKSIFAQNNVKLESAPQKLFHFHFNKKPQRKSETGQYQHRGQMSLPSWLYYFLHTCLSISHGAIEQKGIDLMSTVIVCWSCVTGRRDRFMGPVMYKLWILCNTSVRSGCECGCYHSVTAQCVQLICAPGVSPQSAVNLDQYVLHAGFTQTTLLFTVILKCYRWLWFKYYTFEVALKCKKKYNSRKHKQFNHRSKSSVV